MSDELVYPTIKQANALLRKYVLPANIRSHCEETRYNCTVIAAQLRLNNLPLDPDLAEVAGLLHDIGRWQYLREQGAKPGEDYHEHGTKLILSQEGFPEFGDIIARHPLGGLTVDETAALGYPGPIDLTVEHIISRIVCIADKIRRGPGIYTLDQKLDDYRTNPRLHDRYFSKKPGLLDDSIERTKRIWEGLVRLGMNNPPIIRI